MGLGAGALHGCLAGAAWHLAAFRVHSPRFLPCFDRKLFFKCVQQTFPALCGLRAFHSCYWRAPRRLQVSEMNDRSLRKSWLFRSALPSREASSPERSQTPCCRTSSAGFKVLRRSSVHEPSSAHDACTYCRCTACAALAAGAPASHLKLGFKAVTRCMWQSLRCQTGLVCRHDTSRSVHEAGMTRRASRAMLAASRVKCAGAVCFSLKVATA